MSHHKKLDRKSGGGNSAGKEPKEMIGGCCVCSEEYGWAENPLVYCDGDGCSVAVHKHCYGIIKVPAGSWFCRWACGACGGAGKINLSSLWARIEENTE